MGAFEVGLAVMPSQVLDHHETGGQDQDTGIPGFDETIGRAVTRVQGAKPILIEKGAKAVREASEAIARQIAETAGNIANAIESHAISQPDPGHLGLESVEVSFGISLIGGVQAVFSSQVESSAQVTVTLSRPSNNGQPN